MKRKREPARCPGCLSTAYKPKSAPNALLPTGETGVLALAHVCDECVRGAYVVVMPKQEGQQGVLRPYSAHLRKLAKAYELNGDGRSVGLEQAADILDAGKVPADAEKLGLKETRVSRAEEMTDASLLKRAGNHVVVGPPNGKNLVDGNVREAAFGWQKSELEKRLLQVLVWRNPRDTSRTQLALMAGYSHTSGSFAMGLAKLRARGLLTSGKVQGYRATSVGLGAVDHSALPPRTGEALISYWCERVGECASAILQVATTVYPDSLKREELAERTGYSAASGSFASALAKLRTLGLLEGTHASVELMDAARSGL